MRVAKTCHPEMAKATSLNTKTTSDSDYRFIYIDEPITMTDSTDTYYYHTNTLYSVAVVTDSSGGVVEQYRYTAYGKPTILDGQGQEIATSTIGNAYMFTGRRFDTETGLYHYRMRYYSTDLGRFVSRDPIGYVDGMNLYGYLGNSPLMWMDPFGLKKLRPATPPPPKGGYFGATRFALEYMSDLRHFAELDKYKHMYVSYKMSEIAGVARSFNLGVANEMLDYIGGEGFNYGDLLSNVIGIGLQQTGVQESTADVVFVGLAPAVHKAADVKKTWKWWRKE